MTVGREIRGHAAMSQGATLASYTYKSRELGDDDVEIKISHCGVCGSDIHHIDNGWKTSFYPIIPGHEIVGHVSELGKSVTNFKVGDRVAVGAQSGACLDMKNCYPCSHDNDQNCPKVIYTYGSKYPDGKPSQGGYAEAIRLSSKYVFHLPENIPSEYAGPLLCAGITMYSPLKHYVTKPGAKVAIVGIGGLGHLGLQFAKAMGYDVTAISHSPSKKQEAMSLGANHFLNMTSDEQSWKPYQQTFDVILATSYAPGTNWNALLSMLTANGTLVFIGIPEGEIKIDATNIVFNTTRIAGSKIGSRREIKEMLEFASKHSIRPVIEKFPMSDVNKAIERFRAGKIHFRAVLIN